MTKGSEEEKQEYLVKLNILQQEAERISKENENVANQIQ